MNASPQTVPAQAPFYWLRACLEIPWRGVGAAAPPVWCPPFDTPDCPGGASEEPSNHRQPRTPSRRLPLRISAFGFLSDFGFRASDFPPRPVARLRRLLGTVLPLPDSLKAGPQTGTSRHALSRWRAWIITQNLGGLRAFAGGALEGARGPSTTTFQAASGLISWPGLLFWTVQPNQVNESFAPKP